MDPSVPGYVFGCIWFTVQVRGVIYSLGFRDSGLGVGDTLPHLWRSQWKRTTDDETETTAYLLAYRDLIEVSFVSTIEHNFRILCVV